ELSARGGLPVGMAVTSLAEALRDPPYFLEDNLGRHAAFQDQAFTALNTAFLGDGALIRVPRGTSLAKPVHLLFFSTTDEPAVTHARNLVVADAGCRLTLVESYVGLDGEVYFTNAVTEVVAGMGAVIDHYKVQRESRNAFHVATTQVHQGHGSKFTSH